VREGIKTMSGTGHTRKTKKHPSKNGSTETELERAERGKKRKLSHKRGVVQDVFPEDFSKVKKVLDSAI